jgi:undecaprenyl-diphosphatase
MPLLHAIILGVVQGLTEFLPVSSSGHLVLVPWFLEWNDLDDPSLKKSFDVALHLGTLVAVVGYFRRDVVLLVRDGTRAALRRGDEPSLHGRLAWLIMLSSIPAAVVGALFAEVIETRLGTPTIIAFSLIGFGLLLGWSDRLGGNRSLDRLGVRDAVLIGLAQVLALNPGTSRSGITMTAGRGLGLDRDTAARFAFLMSLPITAGAITFELVGLARDGVPDGFVGAMFVGIVTSAIAGWIAVWGTIRLVRTRSFRPFVVYRVGLGVVTLVVVAAGWR